MIVVDTHVLIWLIEGDDRLGPSMRQQIEDERRDGTVVISAMSVWEMAMITRRGRIDISHEPLAWIEMVLAKPGMALFGLEPEIAVRAATLSWDHRDPADRMIVSTAMILNAALATVDREILAYAAGGHVQTIDARH